MSWIKGISGTGGVAAILTAIVAATAQYMDNQFADIDLTWILKMVGLSGSGLTVLLASLGKLPGGAKIVEIINRARNKQTSVTVAKTAGGVESLITDPELQDYQSVHRLAARLNAIPGGGQLCRSLNDMIFTLHHPEEKAVTPAQDTDVPK